MEIQEDIDITKNIPQIPDVLSKAFDAIKKNSFEEVSDALSQDKEFEENFLKVVNSKYFALPDNNIKSIKKAVVMLGLMRVKNIILTLSLKDLMNFKEDEKLFAHSIECAIITRALSIENNNIINPDDAYTLGLLHDIGKCVLYKNNWKMYEDMETLAKKNGEDIIEYENEKFQTNHSILGAMILKKWKMPNILTDCVKYHHAPFLASVPPVCGLIYASDKLLTAEDITSEKIILNRLSVELKDPNALKLMAKTRLEEIISTLK